MSSRRKFLEQIAVVGGGLILTPLVTQCMPVAAKKRKIGLQLYSLRREISKDVERVISKVKEIGYDVVETYGYSEKDKFWGLEPASFARLMKSNNLTSFSGHYGINQFINDGNDRELKACIEAAAAIGQTYLTAPSVSIQKNIDGNKRIAEKFNNAAELCKASGLKFAYHNHDFEFQKLADGSTAYDIFLKETDASLVDFELDLYWVARAGKDPLQLFRDHPGRFTMWHVKDMDKQNSKLNTEVGSGSINFTPILQEAELSGLQQLFVEQENFSKDAFLSIKESYLYLKGK